jgi:hypothetical protein
VTEDFLFDLDAPPAAAERGGDGDASPKGVLL